MRPVMNYDPLLAAQLKVLRVFALRVISVDHLTAFFLKLLQFLKNLGLSSTSGSAPC